MKTILLSAAILAAMTSASAQAQRLPGGSEVAIGKAMASTRPGSVRRDEGRVAGPPPMPSRDQAIRHGLIPPSDAPACPVADRDAEGRCVPRPR